MFVTAMYGWWKASDVSGNIFTPIYLPGPGDVQLIGFGATNAVYHVQARTDFSGGPWQTLGSTVTDGSGLWHFDDPSAASRSRRFYRLAP